MLQQDPVGSGPEITRDIKYWVRDSMLTGRAKVIDCTARLKTFEEGRIPAGWRVSLVSLVLRDSKDWVCIDGSGGTHGAKGYYF